MELHPVLALLFGANSRRPDQQLGASLEPAIAGILPDSVEPRHDSFVDVVRGRLQSFTNKHLLTRLQTKKMARPTGLIQIA